MNNTTTFKVSPRDRREIELCTRLELKRQDLLPYELLEDLETRSGAESFTIGMDRESAGTWLYIARLYLERLDREDQEIKA